jgi:hypothetical protein
MARIKRVEVIALNPEGKVWKRFVIKAGPHKCFTPEGAETVLNSMVEKIEDANPNNKWRLVPIGGYSFKLVWDEADASVSPENPELIKAQDDTKSNQTLGV